jgi:2-polyprenyl-3-methyl-5-hydroxy-6-metoxy-1,4-benzoquinol methylase
MRYLHKNISFINCPICESKNISILYQVSSETCAKSFNQLRDTVFEDENFHKLNNHIKKTLWKSEFSSINRCANCSFVFASPFIAGDYTFYNMTYHGEDGQSSNLWEWEFEQTRASIFAKLKPQETTNLLEIGANNGNFIKEITTNSLINKTDIICTEFSERGIKTLEKLDVTALSVDVRTFNNNPIYQNKFNIICLFQVLEHLDQLDKLFETFKYISKANANIYVAVPNGKRIEFNEKNKSLLDLPPNHIGRYNQKSIEKLAQKFGWTLSEFKIQEQTSNEILTEMLYNRSLQRKIEKVNFNTYKKVLTFIDVNILKVKIALQRKEIGDNIWFCLSKP